MRATYDVTWELENYNSWNLPYAKTVNISPRIAGEFTHDFTSRNYKLMVDPSAVFTVIFDPSFDDFAPSDMR